MAGTISVDISVTNISVNSIAEMIADKLWSDDNVEDLASNIYDECEAEEREDNLRGMCQAILSKLDA